MSLEADIFTALRALVSDRVHPLILPERDGPPVVPAIVYQFISSEIAETICGDGGDATANTRTQVDAYASTFLAARALRLQVIQAMTGMTTSTVWAGGFDGFEPELKLYRCSMDFISHPSS